uniref:Macaca fascicularis brain cDNA clone: QflA-16563, similar to human microtubule-associated protein 1B (MAP1B), transcriptvariant 1, mRNA, RefSeq: NM_005909.2 n=1 Tax=Macaca fascicularis TaxID=9541 RepID=Q25PK4_MACFA|nr:unnamed protein product [Macaca fascicularis]BAE87715.1 unnamed protein product [Macaca fascicularis]BAE89142.1 unnamed protein product [Macaca fascicularis]
MCLIQSRAARKCSILCSSGLAPTKTRLNSFCLMVKK